MENGRRSRAGQEIKPEQMLYIGFLSLITHIATDPVAGAEHAQRITDAINAAAAAAGFGEAVVLSSAEEIVASISLPENVVVSVHGFFVC